MRPLDSVDSRWVFRIYAALVGVTGVFVTLWAAVAGTIAAARLFAESRRSSGQVPPNPAPTTAPWMVAGLGVDIRALIPHAVARGGHVRVGLEDCPLGAGTSNVALVQEAVRLIEAAGGRVAGASEVRMA